MLIKCISCGKKYFTNSVFCPSCSFPTEQSIREKNLSTNSNSEVAKNKLQSKNTVFEVESDENKAKLDSNINEYQGLSYSSQLTNGKKISVLSQLLYVGYGLILLGVFYYFRLR